MFFLVVFSFAHPHSVNFDMSGTDYFTTHSLKQPVESMLIDFSNTEEIKEFHFHTYFYQHRNASVKAALLLRDKIVASVSRKEMIVVCDGVTDAMLPGLDVSKIFPINMEPLGPHPIGSFETWVPKEYLAQAMSFFMLNRGELTILFHPLSRYEIEDHTHRSMFLGPSVRIDLTVLSEDLLSPPFEYPELKLGYSAPVAN